MWKLLVAFIIVAGLLGISYFTYSAPPTPCDGVVKETIPNLSINLAAFKAIGEGVVGKEKIQDVDADAQKITALLKTCCVSLHNGSMKPQEHQACLNGGKNFEVKIVQITKVFEEADAYMQQGKLREMDEKVTKAQTLVDEFAVIMRDLSQLAVAVPTTQPAQVIDNVKP